MTKFFFNTSAFVPFANHINTSEELFRLLDQLSTTERFLFKNKEGAISQKARDFLPADLAAIFKEIEEKGLEPAGDEKQQQFIKELVKFLKELPLVKMTLAFESTYNFVSQVNNVISNEAGGKIILDLVVNQYIIGGAIFEYEGKIKEYTLQEKLNDSIERLIKIQLAQPAPGR